MINRFVTGNRGTVALLIFKTGNIVAYFHKIEKKIADKNIIRFS
jgi:hypothetical protein